MGGLKPPYFMQAPKEFCKALLLVHDGLAPVWNGMLERFQIMHRDPRSGITRIIMTVQNDDNSYRPLDMRTITWLRDNVAWEYLDKYPNPKDMWAEMKLKEKKHVDDKENYRNEYRKWWNKEHRKLWREAIENAERGIIHVPEERERKIYI